MFDSLTPAQWNKIQDTYNFASLEVSSSDFDYSVNGSSPAGFGVAIQMPHWKTDLANRLIHVRLSWVMLMHYFNKGIPDDPWKISPGRKGQSVEFFSLFKSEHHIRKQLFNYFGDMFYYKLYSAFDTVGMILDLIYDLKIDKPDFHKAVRGLSTIRPTLHTDLRAIKDSVDFKTMKSLRHDTTHNALPSGVSKTVGSIPGGITFGVGTYTLARDVVDNTTKAMDLFAETLVAIRKQIAAETTP